MVSDADLVSGARGGNRDDFAALYDRYFDPIYGFLLRMTRHREHAADLVQVTFLRAMQQLDDLRDPPRFRAWLYAIARTQALHRMGREQQAVPVPARKDREGLNVLLARVDRDALAPLGLVPRLSEMGALVWEAAGALDARTYSVLDLQLRQGLDSAEIAEVLAVAPGDADTIVSRMKDRVERAIGSYLLARRGSRHCEELDDLVADAELPPVSPELSLLIDRHARDCEACTETKRRLLSPTAILGAFAAVGAPEGLRERVWEKVARRWDHWHRRWLRRWWQEVAVVAAILVPMLALPQPLARDDIEPIVSSQSVERRDQQLDAPGVTVPPSTTAPLSPGSSVATTVPPTTLPANLAPAVAIAAPPDGLLLCEGESVTLEGDASDPEGATLSNSVFVWTSSRDGVLGSGRTRAATLSVGTHSLRLTATDPGGAAGNATVAVSVFGAATPTCFDAAPGLVITAPDDGETFFTTRTDAVLGGVDDVALAATVSDDRDPPALLVISWTSDQLGALGTGAALTVPLTGACGGVVHVITATVTDSGGNTTSDSVTVTVVAPC